MLSNNANLMVTGGTYVQIIDNRKEFELLKQYVAIGAAHDSGERFNPPRCHPETRGVLLAEIMEWIKKSQRDSFILWLYGPFGAGKSALAQSIAEQCQALGLLAASFFFSRTSPSRNHEKHLVSTIAYHLALSLPSLRGYIEEAIQRDPSIFDRNLQAQLQKLVVGPLCALYSDDSISEQRKNWPKLVVIDGFDECGDPKVQRYILSAINEEFHRHRNLPLLFIITSRPEEHIRMSFNSGGLGQISSRLSLEDYLDTYDDIRVFLHRKFKEIKDEHPLKAYIPATWPPLDAVQEIVRKSSGQFVYAATVVDFVGSIYHRPTQRLDTIFGLFRHGTVDGDAPFSHIDTLYKHIFSSIADVKHALRVLSAVILLNMKVTPENLESFLFLQPGDIQLYLHGLTSVINFEDVKTHIRLLHAPLSDFLLDPNRSGEFHIVAGKAHADFAVCCLRHLELNQVPVLTQYACYNFETHFDLADPTKSLHDQLLSFQLMALHRIASPSLAQRADDMTLSLEDIWYFIPTFFDCIQNSVIFPEAEGIYDNHLEVFDEYLEAELDKYSGDSRLSDLVTMFTVYHSPGTVQDLDDVPLCRDVLLGLSGAEHLLLIDENSLNLRHMVRRHSQSEAYIELLCQFLEDIERSGRHFIDGEKYAKAALRCLKLLETVPSVLRFHVHSSHLKQLFSDGDLGLRAFMWNLECTPPLLLRADHNPELISFLSNTSILLNPKSIQHSYYLIFTRMIKEARVAYLISAYLEGRHDEALATHRIQLEVVAQGFKIPRLPSQDHFAAQITLLTQQIYQLETVDFACLEGLCCTQCVLKQYFNAQSEHRDATSPPYIIVHVEDPFPEIPPDSIPYTRNSDITTHGIINLLCYREWKKLMH